MRSPEGTDYWSMGVYSEIVPQKRLVYTDSFADERGNVVPSTHYGMSGDFVRYARDRDIRRTSGEDEDDDAAVRSPGRLGG